MAYFGDSTGNIHQALVIEKTVLRSWKATKTATNEASTVSFIKALDNGTIYTAGRNSNIVFWNGDKSTELTPRDPLVETVNLTHDGQEAVVLIRNRESGASRLEFYKDATRTRLL